MNPDREQSFTTADGKTYILLYGNRALRLAEKRMGKAFNQLSEGSLEDATTLLWAGLQHYHAFEFKELNDVDRLFDELGYQTLGELVAEALQIAMPQPKANGTAPEETPQGNDEAAGIGINSVGMD